MRFFDNTYSDLYGNDVELTAEELNWFYGIVAQFSKLEDAKGIEIVNRNHDEMDGKHKEALGIFWTENPKDEKADCFITIDNYFIHECYDSVFNGAYNLSFCTLEKCIAHEIAHRYQFRHCKRHQRLTEEILSKYYGLVGVVA